MPQLRWIICICLMTISGLALTQETEVVEEIRIQGNRRFPEDSIRYRIMSKVGDPLDPRRVTADVKDLWSTGQFDNVGCAVIDGKEGKILTFVVRELPIVAEVDYRGNKKVTKSSFTDKIEEERLNITEDTVLDYGRVNAIKALMKSVLDEKGYRYGTVNVTYEPMDAGSTRVVFNVRENSKVHIHDIIFEGNEVFTDKKLRRTMRKTGRKWMFSWLTGHSIFKDEHYVEDVEKVKKKYWKKGYKDVFLEQPEKEVTDHTTEKQRKKNIKRAAKNKPPKEDRRMILRIPIFEGEPYYMGEMTVEGNTVLPTPYYTLRFPIKSGEVYDLGAINEWLEKVEEIHNNLGYVNFNAEQKITVADGNVVNVHFVVNERDQVYVNRIDFKGNTTTRDKVLRREVLLREGDVFRLNHFRNSMLRVNQLGFFDVTHHEPKVNMLPGESKVNITIQGQETGVNELNFGLGFSEVRGSSGFLSFATSNFLGRGERLSVQANVGDIVKTYDISFSEPWLFDKPRGVTARVFNTRTQFAAAGFDVESTGFQAGLSFRPSIFTTYSINYLFSEDRFPSVSTPIFKPVDDLLTSSISQNITYSTINHPYFPSAGFRASLGVEFATWQSGGDNFYYKLRGGLTKYLPAIKKSFIGLNVEAAYMETLEGQRPTQNQLFYLGGEDSVRGYRRRSLGPTITTSDNRVLSALGDKSFQANFEYIIPVNEQFRFVFFYDTGMIYGIDEDWFETDLVSSTGLELRFSLPIFQAPLRLMYVYRLDNTGFDDKGGGPEFSIGTTF